MNLKRTNPAYLQRDGSLHEAEVVLEHIAGPHCDSIQGYCGHKISRQEMQVCQPRSLQLILF